MIQCLSEQRSSQPGTARSSLQAQTGSITLDWPSGAPPVRVLLAQVLVPDALLLRLLCVLLWGRPGGRGRSTPFSDMGHATRTPGPARALCRRALSALPSVRLSSCPDWPG